MAATLTRTQRQALEYLRYNDRAQGRLWPAYRGRHSGGNVTTWSERTLQALVDAGVAEWAPRRDGVMPHIVPTYWEPETFVPDRWIHNGSDDEMCAAEAPRGNGYVCTRIRGHVGPHMATTGEALCAGWSQ